MSVTNQHDRLTVNRIFEVISPLTIGHILTCQSVAIFTCQNCHNIYISILLPPLRAGAVRCRANVRTSLQLRFLSPNIRKQPKFRYSPLHIPACGWAFIIGRLKIRNLVFPVSTTLVGTSLTTAQAKLPYEVSNSLATCFMDAGTFSGQTEGVLS